jgi:hypothetical protein
MRIWIQILLLGVAGSGRIHAVSRIADPRHFNADLDPLFNANPCRDPTFHFNTNLEWIPL